jgi:hypothetical protein
MPVLKGRYYMAAQKTFKLHWLHGDTEFVKGNTIAEAFMLAGYGGGAIRALDWYEECAADTMEKTGTTPNKPSAAQS